jgi:phosphate acetyltransferase
MLNRPHMQRLVERVRQLPPLPSAIVFPCERDALQLALSGAFAAYIAPTLVGPETRVRDVANRYGLDISRLPIVDTPDEPRAAAERAVALARDAAVSALIRGSISTEDMLAPVAAPETGLRTERRLSHAFFLDLPGQPRSMLLADAHLNVNPNLAAKRDIVQSTVQLAHALGIEMPNVALLAALDGPSPAFPSTADAAALRSMGAQGMFGRASVEGPFTPDTALVAEIARAAGIKSQVAGNADVLIAPGMEPAIMLLRALTGLTQGLAAGLVLGAKVPIVMPSRQDPMEVRMASCVLASLASAALRAAAPTPPEKQVGQVAVDARPRVAA